MPDTLVRAAEEDATAAQTPLGGMLRISRTIALLTITTVVTLASLVSFSESYRGLYLWADEHGLTGIWAAAWPIQVDVFIAVGELSLFVALVDRWPLRARLFPWLVALTGLAVSVAGNVGHVSGDGFASRATAAVPPLAAASALAVGLGVLKRVVAVHADRSAPSAIASAAAPTQAAAGTPSTAGPVANAAATARSVADARPAARPVATTPSGLAADHDVDTGIGEGNTPRLDLASVVRSAHAAGWTKKAIGEEYGLSRYRVNRLLEVSPAPAPATDDDRQADDDRPVDDDAPAEPVDADRPSLTAVNGHPHAGPM